MSIILIAFFLRVVGLIPNIAHPDEAHVQTFSWDLAKNIISYGDFNPHTFKYGSLMFYLQTLTLLPIFLATFLTETINVFVSSSFTSQGLEYINYHQTAVHKYSDLLLFVGRFQTAIWGTLSILLLYLLTKRFFSKRIAFLSALLFAIAPLHVRDSHYITTDILSLFFILLSLYTLSLLIEFKSWKWFIISGIVLGVAASIKYFPLAFLAYPLALMYSFEKKRQWFFKAGVGFLGIFLGLFLGLPFLFLDSQSQGLFQKELNQYILPWYSTSLSNYFFSVGGFITSLGKSPLPSLDTLIPQFYKPFYLSYIMFKGFGIIPTILGIVGLIYLLWKRFRVGLFLSIIPVFTFLYLSLYVPSSYERTAIPILPFLAMFASVPLDFIITRLEKKKLKKGVIISMLLLVIAQPFFVSTAATISCGQTYSQKMSSQWVDKNIPDSAKIGYVTLVSVPSHRIYQDYRPLEPIRDIGFEEARDLGLDHVFINGGRLDYETYPFFNYFFFVPEKLFENSYYSLILSEYESRANLLGQINKPSMCDTTRISYYKISPKKEILEKNQSQIKLFNFNNKEDLTDWRLERYETLSESRITHKKEGDNGFLEFSNQPAKYTSSSIRSNNFPVIPNSSYTLSALVRSGEKESTNLSQVVLRLDFYNNSQGIGNSLKELFQKGYLLLKEGPTAIYFEEKRQVTADFSNNQLPGKTVALSPRTKLPNEWTKVKITATAPSDAKYAVLSIFDAAGSKSIIDIDNIELLSP